MTNPLDRLAERQMQKALAEGKLQGLEGEGRPLPEHPEASVVDPGLAVGLRIMAESGALPPEVGLKREVEAARTALAGLTEPEARRAAMARLADLELRLALAVESRRRFFSD